MPVAKAKTKGKTASRRRRPALRSSRAKQASLVEQAEYELDEETDEEIETAYRQLPRATRKWLRTLTPAKIGKVERTIRAQEMADAFGWGAKWLFIAIVTIFGGIGTVIYGWNLLIEKFSAKVSQTP